MRRLPFWLGCAALLSATACSRPRDNQGKDQWPVSRAELAQAPEAPGASTYRRYCVSCHGMDGRGNGGVTGLDFVGEAETLAGKTDAELEASVRDGKVGSRATMPAHRPILSDAKIAEVVDYVRSQYFKPAEETQESP